MAKITMDSSEWEEMKKNAKLLEEAVAREKELGARVEELQQANIDALKANEKMVNIVKRVQVSESLICSVPVHDITSRLSSMMASIANHHNERYGGGSRISSSQMEHAFHNRSASMYMDNEINNIKSLFFTEKHNLRMDDEQETITHKGLDQVKADIAKEYAENMSEEDRRMRDGVSTMQIGLKEANDREKEHKIMMKNNRKIISNLEKDVKNLSENSDLQNERLDALRGSEKKLNLIKKTLKRKRGILRNSDILRTLDTILRWQTMKD